MSNILVGKDVGTATFDASSQTITFSGLGTVTLDQIRLITNATDGLVIFQFNSPSKGGSISSNVLTLDYDTTTMADDDVLAIDFNIGEPTVDYNLSLQKTSNQTPDVAQNLIEHPIEAVNDAAATYRTVVEWAAAGYKTGSIHINVSGGVTLTLWGSNDDTADNSSDTGWVDISTEILGAANVIDAIALKNITSLRYGRLMIKYVTSDATNASDVWIERSKV